LQIAINQTKTNQTSVSVLDEHMYKMYITTLIFLSGMYYLHKSSKNKNKI